LLALSFERGLFFVDYVAQIGRPTMQMQQSTTAAVHNADDEVNINSVAVLLVVNVRAVLGQVRQVLKSRRDG